MVDNTKNKVLVREFKEDRDVEVVGKLEKDCAIGSNKGGSILTNMLGDPLCRIRFYPLNVMLVAELRENGELVGVIRGCIKYVGTKSGGTHVINLGCILGLRVSPRHRRMGIGLELVRSAEEWLVRNGAEYIFLAVEKNNVASTNLFTSKCSYTNFSSLVIFVQPMVSSFPMKGSFKDIKIEKLQIEQAISVYDSKLRGKDVYPTDMDAILKEKLSLGTWVSYFKDDKWDYEDIFNDQSSSRSTPSSWVIFSVWNSCEAYKIHIRSSSSSSSKPQSHYYHQLKFLHAKLIHAKDKIFTCLRMPMCDKSLEKPVGFLFIYGLLGEGERVGELVKSAWSFASRLRENVKDCKVIMTELGVSDPLIEHVHHQESSMSCINDLWYLKKVNGNTINEIDEDDQVTMTGEMGNVFVDPRDF